MAIGSGSLIAQRFITEVTYGVTPATPTMQALRFQAGPGLSLKKDTFKSMQVDGTRQILNLRHGMRKIEGDIPLEYSVGGFDAFIEAALGGAWTDVTTGSMSLSSDSSNHFIRASGSFITDGFNAGDEIYVSGFATGGNNGRAKVLAVTALQLTVATAAQDSQVGKTLVADTASTGRTIRVGLAATGKSLKVGTTIKSFSIEEAYTDISQFLLFIGCVVNTMSMQIRPGEIVKGSFGFLGKNMTTAGTTAASSVTAATTNVPLSPFEGSIMEGGSAIATITALEFQLNNNRTTIPVVGSNLSAGIGEGTSEITGSVTFLMQDLAMFNKFNNETASSIDVRLNDANGTDFLHINFPNVKYTSGDPNPPKDGAIPLTMQFTALYDSVSGTSMICQRSN